MPSAPTVSVIITTYNRPGMLVQAIASVLAQSYRDFELLVADDGSTEDTADAVHGAGADTIRYLRLPHSGRPSVSRNRAIEQARGSVIAFLDDDDVWRPDKLERQVAHLGAASGTGFVYSDVSFLEADGSESPPVLAHDQKREGRIFDYLLEDCPIATSTVILRRELLERVGGFDEALETAEDYDLWLRVSHEANAGFVPAPLVLKRRHSDTLTHRLVLASYRNAIASLHRAERRFTLTLAQRGRLRRSVARLRTKLGRELVTRDRAADGRREFLRAIRTDPFCDVAWLSLAGSYRPRHNRPS